MAAEYYRGFLMLAPGGQGNRQVSLQGVASSVRDPKDKSWAGLFNQQAKSQEKIFMKMLHNMLP